MLAHHVYSGSMQAPDFEAAAKRHFADAKLLHGSGRLPNADHLSGFAAECALKALVAWELGGQVIGGFAHWPASTHGNSKIREHLGGQLWSAVATLANTRVATEEVRRLLTNDPFGDWHVSDRYALGDHLSGDAVLRHIDGAKQALKALESVKLSNMTGATK